MASVVSILLEYFVCLTNKLQSPFLKQVVKIANAQTPPIIQSVCLCGAGVKLLAVAQKASRWTTVMTEVWAYYILQNSGKGYTSTETFISWKYIFCYWPPAILKEQQFKCRRPTDFHSVSNYVTSKLDEFGEVLLCQVVSKFLVKY